VAVSDGQERNDGDLVLSAPSPAHRFSAQVGVCDLDAHTVRCEAPPGDPPLSLLQANDDVVKPSLHRMSMVALMPAGGLPAFAAALGGMPRELWV
jgi:hypothetical protein